MAPFKYSIFDAWFRDSCCSSCSIKLALPRWTRNWPRWVLLWDSKRSQNSYKTSSHKVPLPGVVCGVGKNQFSSFSRTLISVVYFQSCKIVRIFVCSNSSTTLTTYAKRETDLPFFHRIMTRWKVPTSLAEVSVYTRRRQSVCRPATEVGGKKEQASEPLFLPRQFFRNRNRAGTRRTRVRAELGESQKS